MSKYVLCVPGPWQDWHDLAAGLDDEKFDLQADQLTHRSTGFSCTLELCEHDPRMSKAFQVSGSTWVDGPALKAIEAHTTVVYAVFDGLSQEIATQMMSIGSALLHAGGIAIKVETSGLAHSAEEWLDMAADPHALNLVCANVIILRSDEGLVTCGMHIFGMAEAAVENDEPANMEGLSRLLLAFNLDRVSGRVKPETGNTWNMGGEIAPWTMRLIEPANRDPDSLFYNPHGVWLLTPIEAEEDSELDDEYLEDEIYDESTPAGRAALAGLKLFDVEDFSAAIAKFTEAIELCDDEEDADALYVSRGLCYLNLEAYEQSIADLRRAIELGDESAFNYETIGDCWQEIGDAKRAVSCYTKAIELDPDATEIRGKRGQLLADEKIDIEGALKDLNLAIEADPEDPELYWSRGNCWLEKENDQRAFEDFNTMIHLDPDDAYGYQGRGNAWFNLREWDEAIADFSRALEIDDELDFCWESRADAWVEQQEFDNAIADYGRLIELLPDESAGYAKRGRLLADQRDIAAAMEDLNRAIELDPENLDAYVARGFCWTEKGELLKAASDFEEAVKLDPEEPACLYNVGFILERRGKKEEAIHIYTQTLSLDPEYLDAYESRAFTHVDLQQFKLAIADANKIIELSPDTAKGYCVRGYVWQHQGEYETAIADYRRACEIEPDEATAPMSLAWLLATCPNASLRNGKEALQLAQTAWDLADGMIDWAHCPLAAAHAENGDFAQAIQLVKSCLAVTCHEDVIQDCHKMLAAFEAGHAFQDMDGER